jgi:D-alanyl-D-alanine carboxypeptidase (penicillin-binding protein 5/6)
LPWPASGEAAVEVPGVGTFGPHGGDQPQPIASIAKVMTAYLTLRDHPISNGAPGFSVTITPAEVAAYQAGVSQSDSLLAVQAGEVLDERQLLEALLIDSADNVAPILADEDAGSESAFVAQMNSTAAALGLKSTHYADTSGLSSATVSTPLDQIKLAETAMAIPTFANIVGMAQVTLPVVGTVPNYDYALGTAGIIGVKTGSTGAAGGCLLFAARRKVNGAKTVIYGAVLGQGATFGPSPPLFPKGGVSPLDHALAVSIRLVNAVVPLVSRATLIPSGTVVGHLVSAWGDSVPVVTSKEVAFNGWGGLAGTAKLIVYPVGRSISADAPVGRLDVAFGTQSIGLPVTAQAGIGSPSLMWRLTRL